MNKGLWKQLLVLLLLLVAFNIFYVASIPPPSAPLEISYSRFKQEVRDGNVVEVTVQGDSVVGRFSDPQPEKEPPPEGREAVVHEDFRTTLPPFQDPRLIDDLEEAGVRVLIKPEERPSPWATAWIYLLPWILIFGVWWYVLRSMRGKGGPSGFMSNFSKSGAKLYTQETSKITFENVAGLEEAKQELREIVDFLREPEKFKRIGGKVPRGVLLVGPPGTGKTLMARAVAGEAGVPFFSISASQFIEMFVGVGASRVRDLFTNAKKNAPSIIFIDELDAVGRSRGTGLGGGSDEREQTLNQLLSELDGFEPHSEVVVMAATNRPDVIDAALLRPGRFDRQVVVDRPDWRAREEILKVHSRDVPLAKDVNLRVIARGTPGMCGADLESLINEAALIAARENATEVSMQHLERAKDRILMGAERRIMISEREKRITAYHEAGHALVAKFTPGADPVHKVSVIPRGQALGVTQQLPKDDRYHYPRSYLEARIAVCLGGRAAERAAFGEVSTGAQNDLKQATELAEKMVCQWGMSERIGPMAFSRGEEHPFLGRKLATDKTFSEQMAWLIDQEIENILKAGEAAAERIVEEKRALLDKLAEALVEEETLDRERVHEIFGLDPKAESLEG
ncbi:ATP-dependent zinc metalloprotease FtsH [Geoalkalibacter halelectricus]|uniref:ATP-dependent zinc metalloprotease FtsH n=1 Tax=Geoalkalibacter halelectricus TaxID=2847045 RepID=A0ABY5ZLI8_9BACT|nr:ATP-dependent zinc metalloprotease FtsH [Geoalkalibacter halelectricus]MDO3379538.1 ATP-dependent zinc metalloprotease FtsH [Geoalkalibacter halelectricus]UWZ78126.1 ATP-dependent zinc metalloprotease FtsH [Geoalkalibacter halelectricus]